MEEKKLIPKRRFEEYVDEWKKYHLGERVKFITGLTYSPNDIVNSKGILVIRSSNIQNNQVVDADNVYVNPKVVNSDKVNKGDIIVVVRNGSRHLIGKNAVVRKQMANTVIGAFMTGIRTKQYDFVGALLNTKLFKRQITENLGATINQITLGMFWKFSFYFPSEKEQQKIGKFFRVLDERIANQERKIAKVKALKEAYLAEMFPQEGETVPKRRFKGFKREWEIKKLGDIAEVIGGGTPSTSNPEFWNGNINWYSPTEIGKDVYVTESQKKITELGLQNSSATKLPAHKTILFTSRAGIGDMAILAEGATTNQGFQSLVIDNANCVYFIYSMGYKIKKYALKNASGSTFLEISGKELAKTPIIVTSLEEQQKIGAFFKNLDDQIEAEEAKLEKLKQMKEAYLEEMFV